jgi:Fe-S-cluster containining protein
MLSTLRSSFSADYAALLPDFFDGPSIVEARATCGDCVMCPSPGVEGARGVAVEHFLPSTKCCTYHPTLPNFLVGALLSDSHPDIVDGRRRIVATIARGEGVTPLGIAPPADYARRYREGRATSFGRSEALVCPYYERNSGNCSVWRHRESVCTTFFCKHTLGATGHAFWMALRAYLQHVEAALARDAVAHVAPGAQSGWGDWRGREVELYLACADHVRRLDRDAFAEIVGGGAGGATGPACKLLNTVVERHSVAVSSRAAPHLTLNRRLHVVRAESGVAVTVDNRYDSTFLSDTLFEALKEFSSREPARAVQARLRRDHDVDLPDEMVSKLAIYGILVPPSDDRHDGGNAETPHEQGAK